MVNNGKPSGQMVPHVHMHIIKAPSRVSEGIIASSGESKEPDFAKLNEIAKRVSSKLE